MMLRNMIHYVLHNMLHIKKPPSHFLLSWSGSAILQCPFIQQNYLLAWPSSLEKAMPRFGRGSSAAVAGRSGVRWGGALASTVAAAPSFLGGYLVYQASIFRATYFMQGLAGFVIYFIQLLHGAGVRVQEVKPGINLGILSLPEVRHS
jgi:hypothetical protein